MSKYSKLEDDLIVKWYKERLREPRLQLKVLAKKMGRPWKQVSARAAKLGLTKERAEKRKERDEYILEWYKRHPDDLELKKLAKNLGQEESNVCRRAKELGLTNFGRKPKWFKKKHGDRLKTYLARPDVIAGIKRGQKMLREMYAKGEHYRGMKGKTHSAEYKKQISKRSKAMWADKNSYVNSDEHRQTLSDKASKMMRERIKNKGSVYSRSKQGWYEIAGEHYYFRSTWEVNYARLLEWLKCNNKIKCWEYEVDTFWFKDVKRGVRSYTPDFKIKNKDGGIEYHEVKGWMDAKSKTKLKRMAKYYPQIHIEVIDASVYKSVLEYERLYPAAEYLYRKRPTINKTLEQKQ